jgi:hypothetical protein
MLRCGLCLLGIGLFLLLLISVGDKVGLIYFGSCGPSPGALPFLIIYMLAISAGAIFTGVGLVRWCFLRWRSREERVSIPRVTPAE